MAHCEPEERVAVGGRKVLGQSRFSTGGVVTEGSQIGVSGHAED
jgi:hypothetical protein